MNKETLIFDYGLYKKITRENDYSDPNKNIRNVRNVFRGNYFKPNDNSIAEKESLGNFAFYVYTYIIVRVKGIVFKEGIKLKKIEDYYKNDGSSVTCDFSMFFDGEDLELSRRIWENTNKIASELQETANIYFDKSNNQLTVSIERLPYNFHDWYITNSNCNHIFKEILRFNLNPKYSKYIDDSVDIFDDYQPSRDMHIDEEEPTRKKQRIDDTETQIMNENNSNDQFDNLLDYSDFDEIIKDICQNNANTEQSSDTNKNVFLDESDFMDIMIDVPVKLTEEEYAKKVIELKSLTNTHINVNFRNLYRKIAEAVKKGRSVIFKSEVISGKCSLTYLQGNVSVIMIPDKTGGIRSFNISCDLFEIYNQIHSLLKEEYVDDILGLILKISNINK
jgi:hypothetical protein